MAGAQPPGRIGRPPSTSISRLEVVALDLFTLKGFEETTIEEISEAAGIGRRTFFRYYPSKNDLVWGDFDAHLLALKAQFAARPDVPMMDALRLAVVEFNRVDDSYLEQHRRRMRLILQVPALQAHSTLRYASWRAVVQEFVAMRMGESVESFVPRLVGHVALGTSIAAYEQWLSTPDSDLSRLVDAGFAELGRGFAHYESQAGEGTASSGRVRSREKSCSDSKAEVGRDSS